MWSSENLDPKKPVLPVRPDRVPFRVVPSRSEVQRWLMRGNGFRCPLCNQPFGCSCPANFHGFSSTNIINSIQRPWNFGRRITIQYWGHRTEGGWSLHEESPKFGLRHIRTHFIYCITFGRSPLVWSTGTFTQSYICIYIYI